MAFAISLKATDSTADPVRALWRQVAAFETVPSMATLHYAPHITLAVYDDIDPERLRAVLAEAFTGVSALSLTFAQLNYFDTEPLVLWAVPSPLPALNSAHEAVHARIDPSLCPPTTGRVRGCLTAPLGPRSRRIGERRRSRSPHDPLSRFG